MGLWVLRMQTHTKPLSQTAGGRSSCRGHSSTCSRGWWWEAGSGLCNIVGGTGAASMSPVSLGGAVRVSPWWPRRNWAQGHTISSWLFHIQMCGVDIRYFSFQLWTLNPGRAAPLHMSLQALPWELLVKWPSPTICWRGFWPCGVLSLRSLQSHPTSYTHSIFLLLCCARHACSLGLFPGSGKWLPHPSSCLDPVLSLCCSPGLQQGLLLCLPF